MLKYLLVYVTYKLSAILDLRSRRIQVHLYILDKELFFLDHCVTYCCLILRPATLWQYLDLQPSASERAWNSKKSDILSQIWYTLLLFTSRIVKGFLIKLKALYVMNTLKSSLAIFTWGLQKLLQVRIVPFRSGFVCISQPSLA
jgi:hypothetical protein